MKKLLNALLMVVLIMSTLLFTTSLFVEGASQHASSSLVNMEIENRINAIVDEIQEIIPVENDEAVDTLIQKIQEDERISQLVDTYAKQFVHDIASEETHALDMNDEVHGLLLGFSAEFEDVMGDVINPVYKEAIIKEVITRVDFNEYYAKALTKVKTTMEPSQLKMVKLANTVLENTGLYRTIALGIWIVMMILLAVINFTAMLGMKQIGIAFVLSGLLHLATRWFVPAIIEDKLAQLKGILDFSVFLNVGIGLIVVGLVLRLVGSRSSE